MNGLQFQSGWRSPFWNPKFHETRTFLRPFQANESKGGDDFLQWHRIKFDAGHSVGFSSAWSLLLVSCGHHQTNLESATDTKTFVPVNVDYLGLFLDDKFDDTEAVEKDYFLKNGVIPRASIDNEKVPVEFVARCVIEVLEIRSNKVITTRELETSPRECFSSGFWGWRKINPITTSLTISSLDLLESVLNVRITFTLTGNRKDTLTKIPSSHVNLMVMEKSMEEKIAMSIYTLVTTSNENLQNSSFHHLSSSGNSSGNIVVETACGKQFRVHKSVLSQRSQVFARMFETEMEEWRSSKVQIKDICYDSMDCFLRHLYTGQLETEWLAYPKIAKELVNASEKYWFPALLHFCDENLVHAANERNGLQLLELAHIHNLKTAVDDLTKFVEKIGLTEVEEKQYYDLYTTTQYSNFI